MTTVLLWKEYRQQRAVWLAVAIVGILLVATLTVTLGRAGDWSVFQEAELRETLNLLALCLVVAYGICAGAAALAGEREIGTLGFLDNLACLRRPVWRAKLVAGILFTLLQSAFLAALALGLGFGTWHSAVLLPAMGLLALCWGLLGGALGATVLTAILAGIAAMACSWAAAVLLRDAWLAVVETAAGLGAGYASYRIFCRPDGQRRSKSAPLRRLSARTPASWRVLAWLALRQGRWILGIGFAAAVVVGLAVNAQPLVIWPLATLAAGVACGLAVFCPDQEGPAWFLAAQRFPPGRLWLGKTLFWAAALTGMTTLAWSVAMVHVKATDPTVPEAADAAPWLAKWLGAGYLTPVMPAAALFLGLWPLYGFCVGQFFGQLARRNVIAAILATFSAPAVVAMGVPSLVCGGTPTWQWLCIPALLLMTTRLVQGPWLAGRLATRAPMLVIAGTAGLMVALQAGFLWQRAVEVPDVGEPFDVKAFLASMPSVEKNEAGPLIRSAAGAMRRRRLKVEEDLSPPPPPRDLPASQTAGWESCNAAGRWQLAQAFVLESGWPQDDREINRWLDGVLEGASLDEALKAAQMPLGMVQDPRLTQSTTPLYTIAAECLDLAKVMAMTALRTQSQGKPRDALIRLETVLALARQVENYAPVEVFVAGNRMELSAYQAVQRWLEKVGPDKALLQASLTMLQRHEAARPAAVNSIKAEYLVRGDETPRLRINTVMDEALRSGFKVPWEKERQRRLGNAILTAEIQRSLWPSWKWMAAWKSARRLKMDDEYDRVGAAMGLPLAEGPTASLNARQWGELLYHSWSYVYGAPYAFAPLIAGTTESDLLAIQLVIAAAFYQANHDAPPAKLEDLVPEYLPKLPIDPRTGGSFAYDISSGEVKAQWPDLPPPPARPKGQAAVWSEANKAVEFPVPLWSKKD